MTARSCVVLGAARNGTSIVAGLIAATAGHYLGHSVWPANEWNPTGYFESRAVNDLNDELLRPFRSTTSWQPPDGARWLMAMAGDEEPCWPVPPDVRERMARLTAVHPFCLKDPRFCYTLRAWGPFLADALRVCVFRDPLASARSIVGFAAAMAGLTVTVAEALEIWRQAYLRVLRQSGEGEWVFLNHAELRSPARLARLERAVAAPLARHLVHDELALAPALDEVPAAVREVYAGLCARV